MPLEEFIGLVEELQDRIQKHGSLLRGSEALTRYVLIDPFLRALGWDTENPDHVRPEYPGAGGYADYALMHSGKPVALLEAKKLGEPLTSGVGQALNYYNQQGINYMVVTDGCRWEMYEVFRQAPIDERKLMFIDIASGAAYHIALTALHLWQPNLGSGRAIVSAPERVVAESPGQMHYPADPNSVSAPPSSGLQTQGQAHQWTPIQGVHPTSGDKAPVAVRFPDGEVKQTKYWKDVLFAVADWLTREGALKDSDCPIGRGHSWYLVHTVPRHPSGKDFYGPQRLSSGLFLENWFSSQAIVRNATFLLDSLGQQATQIDLEFG